LQDGVSVLGAAAGGDDLVREDHEQRAYRTLVVDQAHQRPGDDDGDQQGIGEGPEPEPDGGPPLEGQHDEQHGAEHAVRAVARPPGERPAGRPQPVVVDGVDIVVGLDPHLYPTAAGLSRSPG
jgi:hypothetical protein